MTEARVCWRGPRFLTPSMRYQDHLVSEGGRVASHLDDDAPVRRLPEGYALPGLIDSHAHLALPGHRPGELRLDTRTTTPELQRALQGPPPTAGWWLGGGWEEVDGSRAPTRALLSRLSPEHPAALRRYDEHALWVNDRALERSGVLADTPDPPGGRIERDARGEPTGLLIDAAMELVERHIPPPDAAEVEAQILSSAQRFLRYGVTCVHDMAVSAAALDALQRLDARGALPLRVRAYLYAGDPDNHANMRQAAPTPGPDHLRVCGLKLFSDGALGSQGARLSVPYPDGGRGVQPDPEARFTTTLDAALAGGWQVAVHAIGDEAVDETARRLAHACPGPHARWRIEHAQILKAGTAEVLARAGIGAAVQPVHATHDLPWARDLLPPPLLARAYPWRTLLEAGVPIGLGTDHPIEPADARATLLAATLRATERWRTPLPGQAERLTRREALDAHWRGSAWLAFDEPWLGQLSPGSCCDFAVWDTDLLSAPPDAVAEAEVLAVVVGGRVVA